MAKSVRGGEKFEAALAKIAAKLNSKSTLRVGFLEDATYPDGQSVAEVAFWNNYGTKTIPARPFFSNMVAEKSKEWPKAMLGLLKSTNLDEQKTLELTGQAIKEQLQQSIKDTNLPPLAQSTIDAKGFDKPLIHHSVMINSANFDIKD